MKDTTSLPIALLKPITLITNLMALLLEIVILRLWLLCLLLLLLLVPLPLAKAVDASGRPCSVLLCPNLLAHPSLPSTTIVTSIRCRITTRISHCLIALCY